MSDGTLTAIESSMIPLVSDFGLMLKHRHAEGNLSEVTYENRTTGLRVAVDWSEFRPFLHLYRVGHGEESVVGHALASGMSTSIFDVDDLLLFRKAGASPVGKMIGSRDDGAAARLLAEYAAALREHAADVLGGDFEVFRELDKIVRARAKTMQQEGS